jgi:uncharacterized protein YhaN
MIMKIHPAVIFNYVASAAIIISTSLLLSSCSTTGMQRSENASTSMVTVRNDIREAVAQISITDSSLQDLVAPGQSNVKKAFEKYADNVDKMEKKGNRLLEHVEKMHDQGKEYFEEWRSEGNAYANPQIAALSEQRRADLSAVFAEISSSSVGVKGNLKTYMSDIKEIKTYLSNDLTPKGIESIAPVSGKAISDGESLKSAVDPILHALDNAERELAPGGAN